MSTKLPKTLTDLVAWLGPPAAEHLGALATDLLANGNKADAMAALERARRAAIRGASKASYRTKSIVPKKRP